VVFFLLLLLFYLGFFRMWEMYEAMNLLLWHVGLLRKSKNSRKERKRCEFVHCELNCNVPMYVEGSFGLYRPGF
jgi:hypothetical protein